MPPTPAVLQRPTALCGFKEYIFSDKAGALAEFAAATEYAFATVVQVSAIWAGDYHIVIVLDRQLSALIPSCMWTGGSSFWKAPAVNMLVASPTPARYGPW